MYTYSNNTIYTLMIREGIKNGTSLNRKWLFFSNIPPPVQMQHIGIWNKNIHWNVFYCFLCLQLLKVFHLLHSGPTIPFEDGELPQDTCRARGKADIRYSKDYHVEIRYSKDYHVKTFAGEPGDFRGSSWRSRYEVGMVPQVKRGIEGQFIQHFWSNVSSS